MVKNITDIVVLIKGLTKDKSGTFILGLFLPIVPCYFIITSLKRQVEDHTLELNKVEKREEVLRKRADTLQQQLTYSYQNGFTDGKNSVKEQLDLTLQMYDDIESKLSKKERKLREEIDKSKKQIGG